jgi:hypothetical protein
MLASIDQKSNKVFHVKLILLTHGDYINFSFAQRPQSYNLTSEKRRKIAPDGTKISAIISTVPNVREVHGWKRNTRGEFMNGRIASISLAALTLLGAISSPATAQRSGDRDRWEQLGCVEVGRRVETDIIRVGRGEGRFKAVRLLVDNRDIRIADLKVIYTDGQSDSLAFNAFVRAGSPSRPLQLAGWARSIERIELLASKTPGEQRGRAEVCIEGLRASRDEISRSRDGERGPDRPVAVPVIRPNERGIWIELGCERAGFIDERDVIKVGRQEGRFRALRLVSQGNKVDVREMTVVYANGRAFADASRSQ